VIHRNGQQPVGQRASTLTKPTPASTMTLPPVRVAVLSDSALFRSGIRRLLGTERSFLVVAELTARPVRELLRGSIPQILLVDAQTEGALEVCCELRPNGVRPWVILAGADQDDQWAVEALKMGARGILPKSASVENLLKAIRVVHKGEVWATNRVITLTIQELTARSVASRVGTVDFRERLSRREQEIVHLIVGGLSNLEAAVQLGITEATVKAHLTRIFQKLALRGRAQLAARYHGSVMAAAQGAGRALQDA
jgi:DNA-binding NarL/FixJ family response regulator